MSRSPYDVILKPVISERSMTHAQYRKYTFRVATDANKTEIKHAVEEVFGVQVKKVNVMNYTGKLKRMGKNIGRRSSFKKAIVTLAPGSKEIEFFSSL
jgi:large subunit ribosomal protein L23